MTVIGRRAFLAGMAAWPLGARPSAISFELLLDEMIDRDAIACFKAADFSLLHFLNEMLRDAEDSNITLRDLLQAMEDKHAELEHITVPARAA